MYQCSIHGWISMFESCPKCATPVVSVATTNTNYVVETPTPGKKLTPMAKAIENIKFLEERADHPFAKIAYGMAISVCELHLEAELEYASQQAQESTPPVSAMEDETEKIFKPYCIDFFSKESEEERKIKIDFALNKKNESFSLFQSMYDQNYGSINIDENLVSIHTGGWSENEYLISIFKNTEWWRQNFRIQITGGHYYFDTDRINGMKEWDITKRISTTPTK